MSDARAQSPFPAGWSVLSKPAFVAVLPAHPIELGGVYSAPRETAEAHPLSPLPMGAEPPVPRV